MVISGTLALIATTISVFGLVNTGANVAGAIHDQSMINESLENMKQTQELLEQKAQSATGANKEEMLIAAGKLEQINSRMKELNNRALKGALRNEAAGFAKGLLTGGGAAKLGDVVKNAVEVGSTVADQTIGNKGLSNALENADMSRWNAAAKAGDSLDIQILILQARELANKTKGLDKEMKDITAWYEKEKPGNTDSTKLDNQIAELVDNNQELAQDLADTAVLKDDVEVVSDPKSGVGLDFPKDIKDDEANDTEVSDPKSGVGLDFLNDIKEEESTIIGEWHSTEYRLQTEIGALNGTGADGKPVERVLYFEEGGVLDREDKPFGGGVTYSWEKTGDNLYTTISQVSNLDHPVTHKITYELDGDQLISKTIYTNFSGKFKKFDISGRAVFERK